MRAAYRQRLLNIGQALERKIRHSGVLWPFMAFRNTSNTVLRDTPESEIAAAQEAGRPVIVVNFVRPDGEGGIELEAHNVPDCDRSFTVPLPAPGEPCDGVDAELREIVERSAWDRL
jgi:hypothetical protein